jgi:hypothetical protein
MKSCIISGCCRIEVKEGEKPPSARMKSRIINGCCRGGCGENVIFAPESTRRPFLYEFPDTATVDVQTF